MWEGEDVEEEEEGRSPKEVEEEEEGRSPEEVDGEEEGPADEEVHWWETKHDNRDEQNEITIEN